MLALKRDEVHVWRATLDVGSGLCRFAEALSADEWVRAQRFYFRRDREHFIVARGLLRTILGRYLGTEAGRLRFRYSRYGKPSLAVPWRGDGVEFNLAHSGRLALLAFAYRRNLGIDVERIRPELANERIAERFFSPREVAALRALPVDLQVEAFFNCWTRKEAYIKAHGWGLSIPLSRFSVSLVPGEPAVLLRTDGVAGESVLWSLRELNAGTGYVAALAVEGHGWTLKQWQWRA